MFGELNGERILVFGLRLLRSTESDRAREVGLKCGLGESPKSKKVDPGVESLESCLHPESPWSLESSEPPSRELFLRGELDEGTVDSCSSDIVPSSFSVLCQGAR